MKWFRRSTSVVMATIAIGAAGAATAHAACPVLDPRCVIEEPVDDRVGLVDVTVGGIETPVDEGLDPHDEVVDPVVGTILATVDDVIGGGEGEDPGPPGGTGNGDGTRPEVHRGEPAPSGAPDRATVDIAAPRVNQRPEIDRGFVPAVVLHPIDAAGSPVEGTGHVGVAIGAVARSLAIVLGLFGLTLAFAAIQDRLDRNDPRLSLAPIRSDVVTFA